MTRGCDPAAMTAEERLAEVGSILATAFRRLRDSRDGELATIGDGEAL